MKQGLASEQTRQRHTSDDSGLLDTAQERGGAESCPRQTEPGTPMECRPAFW